MLACPTAFCILLGVLRVLCGYLHLHSFLFTVVPGDRTSPHPLPSLNMIENTLATTIIGAAIDVHRELGPGLLESIYEECLAMELRKRGVPFEQQVPVPIIYKGERVRNDLRLDIWVDRKVIVEVKAVEVLHPIHWAQTMTYLKLTNNRLGLLMNFNVDLMKNGVERVANRMY